MQKKTFDSIRWTFLFKVMEKFHLNEAIIRTVEALEKNQSAQLKIKSQNHLVSKDQRDKDAL